MMNALSAPVYGLRSARYIYYLDGALKQNELDQMRQFTLIAITGFVVSTLASTVGRLQPSAILFNRVLTNLEAGTRIGALFYLASIGTSMRERMDGVIDQGVKWVPLMVVTTGIALSIIGSPFVGVSFIAFQGLAELHRKALLPSSIENAITYLGVPLHLLSFIFVPVVSRMDLLFRVIDFVDLLERCNNILHYFGKGVSLIDLTLPKIEEIDTAMVKRFADHCPIDFDVKTAAIDFIANSVHRIPNILEIQYKDGLEKVTPQNLAEMVLEKVKGEGLESYLGEGYTKITNAFSTGNFSDVIPVRVDLFNQYLSLLLHHLLTLEKDDLRKALTELDAAGNQCADMWVEEISEQLPGGGGIERRVHEYFSKVRSEWLKDTIQKTITNIKGLSGFIGGANNVHYMQKIHLVFRGSMRTRLGEVALASSANVASWEDLINLKLCSILFFQIRMNFFKIEPRFWVNQIHEAMQMQLVKNEQGRLKSFQTIPQKALMAWIEEKQEVYPLMSEDGFGFNPVFFRNELQMDGTHLTKLTDAGVVLLLADLGVLKVTLP
ncbi:MAG: hypothetical protein ACOYK9_06230 [Chlamydiia bacterium]